MTPTAPPARGADMHTPGDWLAAAGPSSVVGWPVVGPQGRSICSVTWMPRPDGISDDDWRAFNDECRANAQLIAAAPAMLAALREIKRNNEYYNFGSKLLRIVLPAIAKAEGRT